jgi:hypothetical protein
MSKKIKNAQLKIQQMSFMLLAVIIFFVLVGLFYMVININNMYKTATKLNEEQAQEVASIIAGTAEFSCGEGKVDCIDYDKIMVLKNRTAYNDFWPVSSIEIYKIYPAYNKVECNIANYDNCSIITVYDKKIANKRSYSRFVSICRRDKINDLLIEKCEIGKIVVGAKIEQK